MKRVFKIVGGHQQMDPEQHEKNGRDAQPYVKNPPAGSAYYFNVAWCGFITIFRAHMSP